MLSHQINLINTVSIPVSHPDGSWACVSRTRPDLDADAYTGQLWRIGVQPGEAPRRLTRGFHDSAPKFSPTGEVLGFLRAAPGGRPQLQLIAATGGEPVAVTDAPLGVSDFAFSPDGSRIVFVARVPAEGRYGTLDGVGADAEDPRHFTTLQIRADGVGFTTDRRTHLFVVDTPDVFGEPPLAKVGRAAKGLEKQKLVPPATQLTSGDFDHTSPCFTPDGRAVIVVSARGDDRDLRLSAGLHSVALDRSGVTPLLDDPRFDYANPVVSGDGTHLFFKVSDLGPDGRDFVAVNSSVGVLPFGGEPRTLTDPKTHDMDAGPLTVGGPTSVLAVREHRGSTELLRVHSHGEIETVWAGPQEVQGAAAIPSREREVVATIVDAHTTGDVAMIGTHRLRLLTDFSARLRAETNVATPVELIARASDDYPVHGWVLTPPGRGPHPVLLVIHGGPYAAYHGSWFDEFQAYVAAGYAVVACNPRGSAGYGMAHGRAIRGDFGDLDSDDVLSFLNHALATQPRLDAARLGIMGGSYGGYLTAWIIAHDHRFSGAIVERGFLDPASFVGASDIGWFFVSAYNGPTKEAQDRQSPTLRVDEVTTPTLVLHSENDLRCPLDQALRYYAELKLAGVTAELVVFPGETHELSRSGTPHHRTARFDKIIDWWTRVLPPGKAR